MSTTVTTGEVAPLLTCLRTHGVFMCAYSRVPVIVCSPAFFRAASQLLRGIEEIHSPASIRHLSFLFLHVPVCVPIVVFSKQTLSIKRVCVCVCVFFLMFHYVFFEVVFFQYVSALSSSCTLIPCACHIADCTRSSGRFFFCR